jgi:hypothetical protein
MDKEETAMAATLCGTHALDFYRQLAGRLNVRCLVLVAQIGSDDGPVNVAISWPEDQKLDAAAVTREAGNVFEKQASG